MQNQYVTYYNLKEVSINQKIIKINFMQQKSTNPT